MYKIIFIFKDNIYIRKILHYHDAGHDSMGLGGRGGGEVEGVILIPVNMVLSQKHKR